MKALKSFFITLLVLCLFFVCGFIIAAIKWVALLAFAFLVLWGIVYVIMNYSGD